MSEYTGEMKLNLGCGSHTPAGWLNVDYSLGARAVKLPGAKSANKKLRLFNIDWDRDIFVHDLRSKFPWGNGEADTIYSSHTLEHLSRKDGLRFLEECYRVLKPGGLIRIVVPDLAALVSDYTSGKVRADAFVESLGVLPDEGPGLKGWLLPFIQHPHKCMYDNETLLEVMRGIGFECETGRPLRSRISDIKCIELPNRTENAVIVEGVKP